MLKWLQAQPGVKDAVDALLAGNEGQALPVITRVVKAALAEAGGPSASAGAAVTPKGKPDKRSNDTSAKEDRAAKKHRGEGSARCVCVVVVGLHGCGKSATCKILRETLGGAWLNYDEFAARYEGGSLRSAFATEFHATLVKSLANAGQDRFERFVFLDRNNLLRSQRSDVLQVLRKLQWRKRGGKFLVVEFCHTTDSYGYGRDGQLSMRFSERHIALCARRVEERGPAHVSLHPSPKLKPTLSKMAKSADALTPEELAQFDGRIRVDVALTPPEIGAYIVEELRKLEWMPELRPASSIQAKLQLAWTAYARAESQWREGAVASLEPAEAAWFTQCRKALEAEKAKEKEASKVRHEKEQQREQHMQQLEPLSPQQPQHEVPASAPVLAHAHVGASEVPAPALAIESPHETPIPLYWKIDLPEVSKVLSTSRGLLPASQTPVEHPHATLLYLGGDDDKTASKRTGLGVEQFKAMREALEALQEEEFEVRMTEIVVEESVACAVIELPPIVPCANKVPHVTLGTKPGVVGRYANDVLEEVKAGRREGITVIPLPTPRPLRGTLRIEYSKPTSRASFAQ